MLSGNDVCPGDGAIGELVRGHDLDEMPGAWASDLNLEFSSTNSLKVIIICVFTFILGYSIHENSAFLIRVKVIESSR